MMSQIYKDICLILDDQNIKNLLTCDKLKNIYVLHFKELKTSNVCLVTEKYEKEIHL